MTDVVIAELHHQRKWIDCVKLREADTEWLRYLYLMDIRKVRVQAPDGSVSEVETPEPTRPMQVARFIRQKIECGAYTPRMVVPAGEIASALGMHTADVSRIASQTLAPDGRLVTKDGHRTKARIAGQPE